MIFLKPFRNIFLEKFYWFKVKITECVYKAKGDNPDEGQHSTGSSEIPVSSVVTKNSDWSLAIEFSRNT